MGVEASRPPATASIGSSDKPATKSENTAHAPCATVTAVSATSSGQVASGHIKATSEANMTAPRNKDIMQEDKATGIAPMPNSVKLNASSTVNTFDKTAATSRETPDLDCASVTRHETKCNREFCIPDSGSPCTSGNEAVVATGFGPPGNVNQPPLIERKLSVILKEEFAPVEYPANNSLDSISSAIIPESFEASESLSLEQPFANIQSNNAQRTASTESSLSPCKNSIIIPDVTSTNIISSVLESATENTGMTYRTTPVQTKRAEVPVAVTYADATNLAARYPDLASQILVSPLRNRTARQEVALTPEQESIEESPPSKRRPRRPRRHRSKRSRDNQQESQQQSRGSSWTPGPDTSPSRHKDPSSTSGLVDLKGTSGFHSSYDSRQPDWLLDSAPPTPNPSVERVSPLQTNRHTAPTTPQERTCNYQRESGDANWGAPAAEIQASTPPPTRFATPKRAPVQEQHSAILLKSEERAGKATDLATASIGRRSINADMLLTELFRKAIETSSPSATKFRYPEYPLRKPQAEGSDPIKALVAETAHSVNQAEKIMEGDSPRVKLPAPSTPPMKTSLSPIHKSPTARMEEDHAIRQSYKPPGARTQEDHTLRQSYMPPGVRTKEYYPTRQSYLPSGTRTEEYCTSRQSYLPPAVRTEDHTIPENYKPPHHRLNESNYSAITTQKPAIYLASSLNRHSDSCAPPSPRTIELLERSEHIRHLERLLSRERDLPINSTGLTVPSPKPAQMLQPIGPWRASDEKAFHEGGAINPGTSTNQSLDLVGVMQAMGLDISSRKNTLTALGNGKPSDRPEYNSSSGVRRQAGTMSMEDAVVRNDLACAIRSQGLRSPRGGGGRGTLQ